MASKPSPASTSCSRSRGLRTSQSCVRRPHSGSELAEPLFHAGVDLLIEPPLATVPTTRGPDRRAGRAHGPRGDDDRPLPRRPRSRRRRRSHVAAGAVAAGGGRGRALQQSATRAPTGAATRRSRVAASGLELGGDALEIARLAGPVQRIRMLECARACRAARSRTRCIETEHDGGVVGLLACPGTIAWPGRWCAASADRGELSLGWAQSRLSREDGVREVISGARDPPRCGWVLGARSWPSGAAASARSMAARSRRLAARGLPQLSDEAFRDRLRRAPQLTPFRSARPCSRPGPR